MATMPEATITTKVVCPDCKSNLFKPATPAMMAAGWRWTTIKIAELTALRHNEEEIRKALGDSIEREAALRARCERLEKEVNNVVRAQRFRKDSLFKDDTDFADWAQNRLRAALAAIRSMK